MILGEQNAIFRDNQRLVAVAPIFHPLAEGANLLLEGIDVTMLVKRWVAGKCFAGVSFKTGGNAGPPGTIFR